MASDATIRAIRQSINRLEGQCSDLRVPMRDYRKEAILYFRKYKAAKAVCLKLEMEIKDLKEDLRIIKDGK